MEQKVVDNKVVMAVIAVIEIKNNVRVIRK